MAIGPPKQVISQFHFLEDSFRNMADNHHDVAPEPQSIDDVPFLFCRSHDIGGHLCRCSG